MFVDLLSAIFAPTIILLCVALVDWRLAINFFVVIPFAFGLLVFGKQFFIRTSEYKQSLFADAAVLLVEFISGLKTLRLYNKADVWSEHLFRRFIEIKKASLAVEAWGAGPVVGYRFIVELGIVLLLAACAINVDANNHMLWLFLFFIIFQVLSPLMEVSEQLTILNYAVRSEIKTNTFFNQPLLIEPKNFCKPDRYDIFFENVYFNYSDESLSDNVLNNISFSVPQNTITAIVGPSGSGNSSIMSLLLRFYDPKSGYIMLVGKTLQSIGSEQLYEYVSMVFQNVQLCDGTVLENVRIGRRNATDIDVVEACKTANCHSFIKALTEGYYTRVGEGGMHLSGGERQRLSIARAL